MNARKIAVSGVMGALVVFLGVTRFGMITITPTVSITVMQIPVIIATILEGPLVGVILGFVFGALSLILGAVAPGGFVDSLFVHPEVSILPRLIFPLVVWAVYKPFKGKLEYVSIPLAAVAGSVAHSALVIGVLATFYLGFSVIPLALPNAGIEAIASGVLTTAILAAWKGIEGRGKGKGARL
jgi:uncharacterized membrane protein